MAILTPNYNLIKPDYADSVDVGVLNTNADLIDSALTEKANLVGGKVPASELPSYVDDVIEGYYYNGAFYEDSVHTTPLTGETGKIYVDLSTNASYRWSGSVYIEVGPESEFVIVPTFLTASSGTFDKTNAEILAAIGGGKTILFDAESIAAQKYYNPTVELDYFSQTYPEIRIFFEYTDSDDRLREKRFTIQAGPETNAFNYYENASDTINGAGTTNGEGVKWNASSNRYEPSGYIPENSGNKVTSISDQSGDDEYPSAKAVFNLVSQGYRLIKSLTTDYDGDFYVTLDKPIRSCVIIAKLSKKAAATANMIVSVAKTGVSGLPQVMIRATGSGTAALEYIDIKMFGTLITTQNMHATTHTPSGQTASLSGFMNNNSALTDFNEIWFTFSGNTTQAAGTEIYVYSKE